MPHVLLPFYDWKFVPVDLVLGVYHLGLLCVLDDLTLLS